MIEAFVLAGELHRAGSHVEHALATSKKSTSARSPGRYVSGTKTSRRCRFHSATAAFTSEAPTWWPSPISNSCSRVAVSCCLPPVQAFDAARSASMRGPTFSQTGRAPWLRLPPHRLRPLDVPAVCRLRQRARVMRYFRRDLRPGDRTRSPPPRPARGRFERAPTRCLPHIRICGRAAIRLTWHS